MCVKHFVANDSETERTSYLARVDERTLREVYLAPVRAARARGAGVVGDGRLLRRRRRHDRRTDARAPPAAHRRAQGRVGLRRRRGERLGGHQVGRTGGAEGGLDLQMPGPGRTVGRRPARRGPRRRRQRGAARRQGAPPAAAGAARRRPRRRPPGAPSDVADVRRARRAARARRRGPMVVLHDDEPVPLGRPVSPTATSAGSRCSARRRVRSCRAAARRSSSRPRDDARGRAARRVAPGTEITIVGGARTGRRPPPLDLAALATDPDTARPAIRLELLDADGTVLRTWTDRDWDGWLREVPGRPPSLRLRTTVRLDEPGRHEVGVGTVGQHVIRVGGQVLSHQRDGRRRRGHPRLQRNHRPAITSVSIVASRRRVEHRRRPSRSSTPSATRSSPAAELVHRPPGTSPRRAARGRRRGRRRRRPRDRRRRHQRGDRVRGLRPPESRAARHAGPAGQAACSPRTRARSSSSTPAPRCCCRGSTRCRASCGRGSAGRSGPRRSPTCSPASPSRRAACPGRCRRTSRDVPVPHAIPVDGVVEYHEGVHVGYRSWLRARPHARRAVRSRARLDLVGVRRPCDCRPARRRGRRPRRRRPQHGRPRRARGRPGLRRAGPGADDPDRPVRWLGGFAVVHVAAGAHATVRAFGSTRGVPDLGHGTARLGDPGRYRPDPRGRRRATCASGRPGRLSRRRTRPSPTRTQPLSDTAARDRTTRRHHDIRDGSAQLVTATAAAGLDCSRSPAPAASASTAHPSEQHAPASSDAVLTIGMPNGPQTDNQNPFATTSSALSLGYAFAIYESLHAGQRRPTGRRSDAVARRSVDVERRLHVGDVITARDGVKWSDGRTSPPTTSPTRSSSARTTRRSTRLPCRTATSRSTATRSRSRFESGQFVNQSDLLNQFIVPEHIWSAVDDPSTFTNDEPVGTGPFVLEAWTPQAVTLDRTRRLLGRHARGAGSCGTRRTTTTRRLTTALHQRARRSGAGRSSPTTRTCSSRTDPDHLHQFAADRSRRRRALPEQRADAVQRRGVPPGAAAWCSTAR